MTLSDLTKELEKLLNQAGNTVGRTIQQMPQYKGAKLITTAIQQAPQLYNAFMYGADPNPQPYQAKTNYFDVNSYKTFTPTPPKLPNNTIGEQLATKLGQFTRFTGENLVKPYVEFQMSGANIPYEAGIRSASPYITKTLAPFQDKTGVVVNRIMSSFPKLESQVAKQATFQTTQANKGTLKGLLSETPAQTAFRRSYGVKPGEMYQPEVPPVQQSANIAGWTPVTKKVNALDYLRTPENVLNKIGLGEQSKLLRKQWNSYQTQLPEELNKIQGWMGQAPSKESSKKIFNFLDGKIDESALQPNELKVAGEIKTYLRQWAVKLKLPPERQISSYITHIFEKGANEAEFNDEVAKLIDQKVAGSVYNPFLEKRKLNDIPYVQDVWRALQAYTKRATRKYNMDPVLNVLENSANNLELSQYKYVSRLTDRINMRPTELDNLIDNLVKQSPIGYRLGQRPVATVTQAIRQQIYRGGLGLNVSSALRNLTQGVNTYAKLGEKYTGIGYLKAIKNWRSGELENVGVLRDSFVEDKSLSVFKSALQKIDKGLFYLFETVEKVNRGSAYFGAKQMALDKGMSEKQAIEFATNMVRKTQFVFGSIDTPVALQSDIAKTLTQFGSYSVKQIEFLGEMAKNKEYLGLIRYLGATLALMKVFKDQFGMKLELLPQLGLSPVGQVAANIGPAVFGQGYQQEQAQDKLKSTGAMLIPGGAQIKKTFEGLRNYSQGESQTPSGNMRFPIDQNTPNLIKSALLGQYSVPESSKYYDSGASSLGKNQSDFVRNAQDKFEAYQKIIQDRVNQVEEDKVKKLVDDTGTATHYGNKFFYYDNGVKTIDTSFTPQKPELTGNKLLDSKLISKYKGQITQKTNDVITLYENKAINKDEAEKALQELTNQSTTIATAKAPAFRIAKPKKATITFAKAKVPKFTIGKPKMIKVKKIIPKKLKNSKFTVKTLKA